MNSKLFKIVRFYKDDTKPTITIKTGLTQEEAMAHCSLEETHGKDKDGNVVWFDAWTDE